MNPENEVARLLREDGSVLRRSKRHAVWRLSNGKTFVVSSSPSDRLAADKQLKNLRGLLQAAPADRGQPGERRERKEKPGAHRSSTITAAGVVAGGGSLRDKVWSALASGR